MSITFSKFKQNISENGALGYAPILLNHYSNYTTVANAKLNGLIPRDYLEIVPDKCKCGSDFIITTNLKTMQCVDPYCPYKIANSMSDMFTAYDINGFSEATCKKIVDVGINSGILTVPTHTEILKVTDFFIFNGILGPVKARQLEQAVDKIKNAKITFPILVSKSGIPDFDNSSMKIFKDINSIAELEKTIMNSGLQHFFSKRGVHSPRKITNFYWSIATLCNAEKYRSVPLLKQGLFNRNLCITGAVHVDGMHVPRQAFIEMCNKIATLPSGLAVCTFRASKAVMSVDCVIADNPSTSSTYVTAAQREFNEGISIIITAQQFIDNLREEMKICTKCLKEESQT